MGHFLWHFYLVLSLIALVRTGSLGEKVWQSESKSGGALMSRSRLCFPFAMARLQESFKEAQIHSASLAKHNHALSLHSHTYDTVDIRGFFFGVEQMFLFFLKLYVLLEMATASLRFLRASHELEAAPCMVTYARVHCDDDNVHISMKLCLYPLRKTQGGKDAEKNSVMSVKVKSKNPNSANKKTGKKNPKTTAVI